MFSCAVVMIFRQAIELIQFIRFGLLLVAVWNVFPYEGRAESSRGPYVQIGDVRLAVDSVEPVATDTLKVTVFDDTFLVSKETAARAVASRYIDNFDRFSEQVLPVLGTLLKIVEQYDDNKLASKIVVVAAHSKTSAIFDSVSWWQAALEYQQIVESLATLVAEGMSIEATRECVIGRAWRKDSSRKDYRILEIGQRKECLLDTQDTLLSIFAGETSLKDALGEASAQEQSFASNEDLLTATHEHVSVLIDIARAVDLADWSLLQEMVARVSFDADRKAFLSKAAVFFLHATEEKGVALKALPFIIDKSRTPQVHADIVRIVRSLRESDLLVLPSGAVSFSLSILGDKDEELRHEFSSFVCRVLSGAVTQDVVARGIEVARIYTTNSIIRGADTDRVATCLASAASAYGKRGDSHYVMREWGESLSASEWLRLYLSTMGVRKPMWIFVCLVFLVGWLVVRKYRGRRLTTQSSSEDESGCEVASDSTFEEDQQILRESLAFFGLELGASERDVKNAYRQAVKQYHPDSGYAREDGNEQFIAITQQYERLLQLLLKK
jgi:hypothetical protein